MTWAVELRGVTKRYPSRPHPVLDGVGLALPRGVVAWVGGANGAGKTTLLRLLNGVVAEDAGIVRVHGRTFVEGRAAYQRALGFVPAGNAGLYARLTVRQHVDIWARVAFVPRREHARRVEELLADFGLLELAKARCDRISMGQRQRVRLALGFLGRPPVMLLDEPHSSLDADGAVCLAEALRRLTADGGTAIWCSPHQRDVPIPVDVALRLAAGKLLPEPVEITGR